jgi:hypothetical protein
MPCLATNDAERLLLTVGDLSSPTRRLALELAGITDDSRLSQARAIPVQLAK